MSQVGVSNWPRTTRQISYGLSALIGVALFAGGLLAWWAYLQDEGAPVQARVTLDIPGAQSAIVAQPAPAAVQAKPTPPKPAQDKPVQAKPAPVKAEPKKIIAEKPAVKKPAAKPQPIATKPAPVEAPQAKTQPAPTPANDPVTEQPATTPPAHSFDPYASVPVTSSIPIRETSPASVEYADEAKNVAPIANELAVDQPVINEPTAEAPAPQSPDAIEEQPIMQPAPLPNAQTNEGATRNDGYNFQKRR